MKEEKTNNHIREFLQKTDEWPLFLLGLLLFAGLFIVYLSWGNNIVFDIHDQLDETILSYLLPARHLFEGNNVYSEMMCDLPLDSLKASAPLFIPFYRLFSVERAFLFQFFIETLSAYLGMYFLIRKMTDSSLAALLSALLFAFLPFQPVYGLNIMGLPLLALCFVTLYSASTKEIKAGVFSFTGILYYVSTTHIALAGYVVCGVIVLIGLILLVKEKGIRKEHLGFYLGALILIVLYGIYNFGLIKGLMFGSGEFVSHRQEFVASASGGNFFGTCMNLFLYGENAYAASLHTLLIPVSVLLTVYGAVRFAKLDRKLKTAAATAFVLWGVILVICVVYALLDMQWVADLRNRSGGFIRYTEFNRVYYLLPGLWWGQFGLLAGLFMKDGNKFPALLRFMLVSLAVLPCMFSMKTKLNLYQNVNYRNHDSAFTGTMGMEEYYHEDLLKKADEAIGRDKAAYRVAHVGLSPAPSLVYGFRTADGYSNNYPLEYKHRFREVIARALSENSVLATYYDTWGSRAYLFLDESHETDGCYTNLPFNLESLRNLGTDYIFSDREIRDTDGLTFFGEYESDRWDASLWVYQIEPAGLSE